METPLVSIDLASEDISRKLISLVALSHGTNSVEEAAAALAKAQALALKHHIDFLSIKIEEVGKTTGAPGLSNEPFVTERYKTAAGNGRRPPSHKYITWLLQMHFRVSVITFRHHSKRSLVEFVGRKSDVVFAVYAYQFLKETFNRLWREYKQKNDADTSARNGYFYGLYCGLDSKLETSKREETQRLLSGLDTDTKCASSSWELAMVEEEDLLKQAEKGFHPVLKTVKTKVGDVSDYSAYEVGKRDGNTIEIALALRPEDGSDETVGGIKETVLLEQ